MQVMQCDISGCACETVSGLKTPFRSQDFVCVEDERTGLASCMRAVEGSPVYSFCRVEMKLVMVVKIFCQLIVWVKSEGD